jgi:hypothetical protein
MGQRIFGLISGLIFIMALPGAFLGPEQKLERGLFETIAIWKIKDVSPTPSCYRKLNNQGQRIGGDQSFDIWTGFEAQPTSWPPGELVVKIGYQFPGQAAPVWKFPEYHLSDEISSKPIGYVGPLADPTVVVNYHSPHYIGFIKSKFLIPRSQMNGEGKIMVSIETHGKIKVVKEEKSNPLKACPIF